MPAGDPAGYLPSVQRARQNAGSAAPYKPRSRRKLKTKPPFALNRRPKMESGLTKKRMQVMGKSKAAPIAKATRYTPDSGRSKRRRGRLVGLGVGDGGRNYS